jgi:hypothetical protein
MRKRRIVCIGVVAVAGAIGVAAAGASCAPTPTNIPVRTFQQPKNVDVVCIKVNDDNGNQLPVTDITGLPQDNCQPVPVNVNGAALSKHLYAVVTQTTRGELAVVDLTAGNVVDEDRATPGTNFIPVGTNPTGVVVTPDGLMTFVSSADPNKPAVYGIPSNQLLGDSTGTWDAGPPGPPKPLQLPDLLACSLPQPPQTITVSTILGSNGAPTNDYLLVAVLGSAGGASAKVVAIDPTPLLHGGGAEDAGISDAGPLTRGVIAPCRVLGATALSGTLPASWSPGPVWPDGVPYANVGNLAAREPCSGPTCGCADSGAGTGAAPDASEGADAEAAAEDAGASEDATLPLSFVAPSPPFPTGVALRDDIPILYVGDGALPLIHVIDLRDAAHPKELPPLLATSVTEPTRQVSVGDLAISPSTRDYKRYLYAVDSNEGTLMVFDVTDATASPRTPLLRPHAELNPLQPVDRLGFSAPVATVAFVHHDWPLVPPGSNNQTVSYTGLLCNPNPNAHPDAGAFVDRGAYYRADQTSVIEPTGPVSTVQGLPLRLRGVFGFATLSNGNVVTINVDDWDAPCRRPEPMEISEAGPGFGMTGSLDIPQPDAGPPDSATFLDPYHAPITYQAKTLPGTSAVTQEVFFPVSAPNQSRSSFLLRNDPSVGIHYPVVSGAPQLVDPSGGSVGSMATAGSVPPLLLATQLPPGFIDPSLIQNAVTQPDPTQQTALPPLTVFPDGGTNASSVRLSFDDVTATKDQNWAVTYEGSLPTVASSINADILRTDGDETLTFTIGAQQANGTPADAGGLPAPGQGAGFCERGIEDWTIGQSRANQVSAAIGKLPVQDGGAPLQPPPDLPQWTSDYIEITDPILPQGEGYWTIQGNACWSGLVSGGIDYGKDNDPNIGNERYNACQASFGSPTDDPDTFLERDLPILKAYDDQLVLGRFGWAQTAPSETTNNRVIVGPAKENASWLKFVQCCFHAQAAFKVRTGGEWLTVGDQDGFLNHVVAGPLGSDPAKPASRPCVLSCNPHDVLLNARSFDVPWTPIPWGAGNAVDGGATGDAGTVQGPSCQDTLAAGIDRDSVLAMRNPYFSFANYLACRKPQTPFDHTLTTRDLVWKFSLHGGFAPLAISIAGTQATSVSPQSMRFIESFGQLAIVDGELQGLILIDLNTLGFAHNPYF